jgi:hypothetical protein
MKKRDEPLEEIWEIRRKLAKQFDHDPRKAAAYYREKQRQSGAKLYRWIDHRAGREQEFVPGETPALRETPPERH